MHLQLPQQTSMYMVKEDIANNKDESLITENNFALVKFLLSHKYFILDFMTDKASGTDGKAKMGKMGAKSLGIKSTSISRPYVRKKLTEHYRKERKKTKQKQVIKVCQMGAI